MRFFRLFVFALAFASKISYYMLRINRINATNRRVVMLSTPHLTLAPGTVQIEIDTSPVYNLLTSLYLIALTETAQGFAPWIDEVALALTPERRHTHRV